MNKKNPAGFTLIEVLVALAILGFVLSASLKIFSSNAQVVSALEKKTLASFVAENVLVQTYTFKNELNYATGTEFQGGISYQWERKVLFEEDGKSESQKNDDILILNKLVNEDGTIDILENQFLKKDEVKEILNQKISEIFKDHFDEWLDKNIPSYLDKYFKKK